MTDRGEVLLIRAWQETGGEPGSVRARLLSAGPGEAADVDVADGVEEICAAVRRWLTGSAGAP